jgi:hypothetical protein
VTSIGVYAFYGCTSLITIDIPSSVTSIGDYVFAECSSLITVTYYYGVEIGSNAFYGISVNAVFTIVGGPQT